LFGQPFVLFGEMSGTTSILVVAEQHVFKNGFVSREGKVATWKLDCLNLTYDDLFQSAEYLKGLMKSNWDIIVVCVEVEESVRVNSQFQNVIQAARDLGGQIFIRVSGKVGTTESFVQGFLYVNQGKLDKSMIVRSLDEVWQCIQIEVQQKSSKLLQSQSSRLYAVNTKKINTFPMWCYCLLYFVIGFLLGVLAMQFKYSDAKFDLQQKEAFQNEISSLMKIIHTMQQREEEIYGKIDALNKTEELLSQKKILLWMKQKEN